MTDRTPLPQKEIPGWYITFQAAILQQLPRPEDGMDKVTALRWDKDQRVLKQHLSSLVTPPKIKLSDDRLRIIHTFDVFMSNNLDEITATQSRMTQDVVRKLKQGQKLKVDLIMNGHGISTRNCINYLKSEGALLIGKVGIVLILEQALQQPLGCVWTASFCEENSLDLPHRNDYYVPGIVGPGYTNYEHQPRTLDELAREGLPFFFAFRDAS